MRKKNHERRNEDTARKVSDQANLKSPVVTQAVRKPKDKVLETAKPANEADKQSSPYLPRKEIEKYLRSKRRDWNKTTAIAGVVGLLILLGQSWIYYQTLREASRTANIAQEAVAQTRDQFRQDQRPYVWLTNDLGKPEFIRVPVGSLDSPIGQVVWDWHFTNYGKTPAYEIRFRQYFKIGTEFVPAPGSKQEPSTGSPLPPGKDNFSTNVSEQISAADFQRLLDTDHAIGIRIVMNYTDAYGGKYESVFCLERLRTGAITYCEGYIK